MLNFPLGSYLGFRFLFTNKIKAIIDRTAISVNPGDEAGMVVVVVVGGHVRVITLEDLVKRLSIVVFSRNKSQSGSNCILIGR